MGSPGKGKWTDTPWFAVLDPDYTGSVTRRHFIVYSFTADARRVHLALGQGISTVLEEFGSAANSELTRRADLIRARVPEHETHFSAQAVLIGKKSALVRGFEASVAFGKLYDLAGLPSDQELVKDLREMIRLYSISIARGGVDSLDDVDDPSEVKSLSLEERRHYHLHLVIEGRSSKAAQLAKEHHGYICQGCGFNFSAVYGPLGREYIEAHHLVPFASLPEDVPVQRDPKTDFAVLCANCHRMMHRKGGPTNVAELRKFSGVARLRKYWS